jgi:hypothetical protein
MNFCAAPPLTGTLSGSERAAKTAPPRGPRDSPATAPMRARPGAYMTLYRRSLLVAHNNSQAKHAEAGGVGAAWRRCPDLAPCVWTGRGRQPHAWLTAVPLSFLPSSCSGHRRWRCSAAAYARRGRPARPRSPARCARGCGASLNTIATCRARCVGLCAPHPCCGARVAQAAAWGGTGTDQPAHDRGPCGPAGHWHVARVRPRPQRHLLDWTPRLCVRVCAASCPCLCVYSVPHIYSPLARSSPLTPTVSRGTGPPRARTHAPWRPRRPGKGSAGPCPAAACARQPQRRLADKHDRPHMHTRRHRQIVADAPQPAPQRPYTDTHTCTYTHAHNHTLTHAHNHPPISNTQTQTQTTRPHGRQRSSRVIRRTRGSGRQHRRPCPCCAHKPPS